MRLNKNLEIRQGSALTLRNTDWLVTSKPVPEPLLSHRVIEALGSKLIKYSQNLLSAMMAKLMLLNYLQTVETSAVGSEECFPEFSTKITVLTARSKTSAC